jgi:hypothetical protein
MPHTTHVQDILDRVSDRDLRKAMREIKCYQETGLLEAGVIRETASTLHGEVGMSMSDALTFVQNRLAQRAAFKWAGIQ